jgi:hypothetical protein
MAHSWESPANAAREVLLETLESQIGSRETRQAVIDLVIEEFDRQFSDPDDEMVVAGAEVLAASADCVGLSLYHRRLVVETIWRTMAEKAFGR